MISRCRNKSKAVYIELIRSYRCRERSEDEMPDVPTTTVRDDGGPGVKVRHRDADETRQRLLQAARQRFAQDGYAATTVRDIAMEAGVNVALINRYFTSKEGLFEAYL